MPADVFGRLKLHIFTIEAAVQADLKPEGSDFPDYALESQGLFDCHKHSSRFRQSTMLLQIQGRV